MAATTTAMDATTELAGDRPLPVHLVITYAPEPRLPERRGSQMPLLPWGVEQSNEKPPHVPMTVPQTVQASAEHLE